MPYTKNIAVIRGLKDGFSADGGKLSGLVRAEKYGRHLTVETTYINFAPLSEGRFVTAVTDGKITLVVEDGRFDGESDMDTSGGFAALICYINGGVFPVATAICGNFRDVALGIKGEVERQENLKSGKKGGAAPAENFRYEDEAIAEENYYEFETDESKGALREDKSKEKNGKKFIKDEKAACAVENEKGGVGGLAGGCFYDKMKGEIENILNTYPHINTLEELIENSKWVKISYGESGFYVFGVMFGKGSAEYICYGVPAVNPDRPPESMKEISSYIPAKVEEYDGVFVMYQDAFTGATIHVQKD
ncbi:MAG: hypothetical protein K2K80_07255 [Clostridia bacterium]|nr:hypothetical protein [Clostridia bacterium]